MITEFNIIKKYLKPLAKNNKNSIKLNDDIYFNYKNGTAISLDTYIHGVHFINSSPEFFLKKVLRASLSDLFCKGIKPKNYFLSMSLNKKILTSQWLKKVKKILNSEQKKFNITLSGGDTTFSPKFSITIVVLGYSKNKPVLRNTCKFNDDIYVTGNIGDSFIGLNILLKKNNFNPYNNLFKKKFFEPSLPIKIAPFLNKIASSSIDISDGLSQDLRHLCSKKMFGAIVDLNKIPLSNSTKELLRKKKIILPDIFSNGDDYQVLFTSNIKNRSKITNLAKKINTKISRIGKIIRSKNIIYMDNGKNIILKAGKMGYTHSF